MPFINRSFNHYNQQQPVYQAVKEEPLEFELMESQMQQESKDAAEGKWNEQQNLKFVVFISYYQDIFSSRHKRKVCKIFKTFEEYLQGRTAAQCRSHFQKILMKFKTVAKLRKYFQNHYGKEVFREELEKFKASWQETHPPITTKDLFVKQYKQFGIQTEHQPIMNETTVCRCTSPTIFQDISQTQTVQPNYDPFIYWQRLNQENLGYYCYLPLQQNNHPQFY